MSSLPNGYDPVKDSIKTTPTDQQRNRRTDYLTVLSSAVNLVVSPTYTDIVSAVINSAWYDTASFLVNVKINNSADLRIRAVTLASDWTTEVIIDPSLIKIRDTTVATDGSYFELNTDADWWKEVHIQLDNCFKFIKLKATVWTAWATVAQISNTECSLWY